MKQDVRGARRRLCCDATINKLSFILFNDSSLPPQATPQPRSGRSGACAPSHVAKVGKCGRAHAFPLLMGRCVAVPCGKHACATTRPPVLVNLGSWARVRVSLLFLASFFPQFYCFCLKILL